MTRTAASEKILRARKAISHAEYQLHRALLTARAEGVSWTEIGRLLGMTKQAAWRKYHHIEEEGPR